MPAINWLHLTDLHQGMKGGWLWPTFREEFYRDLEQLHKKSGPWDMVLFTGDLAYSGKKEEYDDLNRFLDDLWTHLKNLGSNPILLPVPGNHDLIRPDSKLGTVRSFKLWHDDEELRDLFWESLDNEYRQTITKAFSSYMEWRQSSPAVPEAKLYKGIIPGDFSFSIEKEGLKTAIIGFNSSYLQLGGGNYEGLLDLDTRQLDGVRDDDAVKWIKDHHTALLLTHHPQSWLHPNSVREFKAEINPPGRFALHLFGHMHEPLSQSIRTGGSPTQRYLQGASLFGMETWGDGTKIRIHGYSAGRLSAEGDTGTLQIWPRKLEDMKAGHRKIIPHYELDLDTDDSIVESFRLSKPLIISEVIPTPPEETYTEKTQPLSIIEPPPSATKSYDLSNYVFFVPFDQKGDQVIGREKDLEKVRNLLADGPRTGIGHAVMIEGFGGLGKTQLAVEYAYDSKDAYNNGIIWINVDQDIETQLVDLVDKGGWIAPESEHKDKLAVARQRLSAYPNCLVILDNVESQDAISNLLQLLHHDTHVLATTRFELYGFEPIPLDPLNDNLSYKLLIQEARREPSEGPETSAALSIVKLLGGLPLAIELAGAYLRHRPTFDWEQYQRFLTNNLKEALPKKFLQNAYTKHKADLYSTLKINESLFEDEPRLRDILDLLTWSGPAPMGADLLCYLLNVEDITELLGALSLGTTLRLLNKPQNIDSYAIHRLVREVRREDIPLEGKEKWVASVCKAIGDWFKKMRNNFSDLSKYEAEIDHLKAWEHNARKFSPPYASRLMWLQAYPSFHQGRYLETQALLDAALVLYTDLGLQDADLKAHLLNDSGTIISLFGDPNTALKRHKESLELRQELHGERHEDVAASLSNVGNTLDHLGRYEEELVYAQRALALRQELFGEKHPDVATSLNNVGSALGRLGRYEEELSYAQRALAMYQELLGEKHPNVATSLNNVGGALGRLGRYEEELSHAQRALALRQELLGEKHPNVATSLSNVGNALGRLGRHEEELVYAQRALALRQELFGEKHPDVATSLNNVGNALGHLGRHEEELSYAQRALAMYQELLGEKHPNVATSLSNVGNALGRLGRYEEELSHAQRALALRQELLGEKHPDVATSLSNVGSALGHLGRYNEEIVYAQRALAMYQELLGEKHPDVAISLNNVGNALGHLGRHEEELSYAQRALAMYQELLGEKHPDVATSLNNVGSALGHLGRYNEEIVYAQRALAMYQELLGEKHPDVATSLNNVGNALGRVGRHEEELVYAQRALALSKDTYGKSHPITLRLTLNLAVSYFNKDDRKSAFDILNPLLHELPKNHILYSEAERLNQSILAKAVRPGFRQPPANPRKRKKKGKRK